MVEYACGRCHPLLPGVWMKKQRIPDSESARPEAPPVTSRLWQHLPVVLILCAASIVILSNLGNQYLWQDEAQTALIAKTVMAHGIPLGTDGKNSFSQDLGAEYGKDHIWRWHPWFQFYLLAGFFAVFGTSTFVARLPFALFGIATVVLTYYFGRSLWDSRRAAIASAAVLTLSVPFLLLSRQCRYYGPDAFFALLGLYGYLRLLERKKYASVTFVASAVLLFHTHYLHYAALLCAVIAHSLLCRRDKFRMVLLLSAGTVILNLPWVIIFSTTGQVVENYGNLWGRMALLGKEYSLQISRHIFPPALLLLALLVGVVNWLRRRQLPTIRGAASRNLALLLLFAAGVFVGAVAMSLSFRPTLPFFRFLAPLIPVACLIIGLILESSMKLHPAVGIAAVVALAYTGHMPDYLYEITHDYDGPVEGIVKYLKAHGTRNDVVAITYEDLPVKFYTDMRVVGGLTGEDLSPALEADWVIIRRYTHCTVDLGVARYLMENLPRERYRQITLDYPDTPFENREDPEWHRFRTATDEAPVLVFQRIRK